MRRRPRPHPRARPVGVWHKRPSVAPTPPRASAVSHAGRLDRQQLPHTREPGPWRPGWHRNVAASTSGREAATGAWQAGVPASTRRARRIGRCCSPCGQCVRQCANRRRRQLCTGATRSSTWRGRSPGSGMARVGLVPRRPRVRSARRASRPQSRRSGMHQICCREIRLGTSGKKELPA